MDCENQLVIYCDVCDSLCIERFYKNHLKSKTHLKNIRKIEEINKASEAISLN